MAKTATIYPPKTVTDLSKDDGFLPPESTEQIKSNDQIVAEINRKPETDTDLSVEHVAVLGLD